MNVTPHPGCAVCTYWLGRISEEKPRALAGCAGAFDSEKRARAALAEHVTRAHPASIEASV